MIRFTNIPSHTHCKLLLTVEADDDVLGLTAQNEIQGLFNN